jgi:iron transport multicopper oxidase
MMWLKISLLAFVPALVHSLASTDSIQDVDVGQSGYLDNHNLHPATVGSNIFGFLWKNTYGAKEKFYAKPLVYTPSGGNQKQLVFLASSMNVIRTVDAVTGAPFNSRTVQPPFLQADIGCTDIPDFIGIIGTPIIDPTTDTVYFFSKGYKNGASSGGMPNGIYQFYGVDINTLADKPGFPVLIDGHNADSDPTRYFVGGTVLQRPSLALVNGVVIGAFGGHCDLFNYTGKSTEI